MQLQQEFFNSSLSGIQDSAVEYDINNSACLRVQYCHNTQKNLNSFHLTILMYIFGYIIKRF